ncbi:VWA domain-containing protein [Bradyrhizobium sp. Arg237L]|uniref:nitric oxide reductase activation protein NorD n=2 Tax=unclassified Bradyrhizobium TaxID=2631580 RepID=UPI00249F1D95|nr:VWA domain-containing protein [Bradyrhizobium sp. Arg237L]MDI4232082.1 VWA domain-containing protein [Bradyrhizobium sp. Arg237L]
MNAAKQVTLQLVPPDEEDSATRRIHRLMLQRETLRPMFLIAWDDLSQRFGVNELEAWAGAVLTLAHVNAGPACLIAYWEASKNTGDHREIAPLLVAGQIAADICRNAGAQAATAALKALPIASRLFGSGPALARWWRVMDLLAQQAPESVAPTADNIAAILAPGTIDAFENFVAAGLKLASGNKARRLAFFHLEDELARRMIARDVGSVTFLETEIELKAFITALWGKPPLLRSLAADISQAPQRRTSIAGPLIRLPETFRGVQGDAARALFRAAAAHAQAHLVLGNGLFPVGTLKPLQIALVNLVEDARIETLAMRQLPGLRRLWAPYHVATPSGVVAAPTLLARLARALFDPAYVDDDSFVVKGRAMFQAALPRIDDPAISREIGMLLGNDLGQMRVQFNVKTYVVEPVYRDDGLGLWDFGENAPPSGEVMELPVDAVRMERQEAPDGNGNEPDQQGETLGRGRPVAPDERGTIIAKYPEWDRAHGIERPEWTIVREVAAYVGDPRLIEAALDHAEALRSRIGRLVRGVRIGRTIRLNRQHGGHDIDIDAALDAGIALRIGQAPDPRVFRSSTSVHRDLAALLLIDVSESTRDRLASGATILDVERLAVAVLAEAMGRLGDPFSLKAFASDGRDDVRMTTVKSFEEPYDRSCVARLAGLRSGLSTRLGTALRHAGKVIGKTNSGRKLVIVLTDGEPSDIDVSDPLDLVEDARRAALGLKNAGVDAYGVVLGKAGIQAASRIFGRGNTMMVHRIEDLPGRLSELYFRLARR